MRKIYLLLTLLLWCFVAAAQTEEDQWVDSVYNSLTNEQRVGQLINVRANLPNKPYFAEVQGLIERYNIGGVTFFRTDAEPLFKQVNEWQTMAQTPLMVAIDGEWGLGMRLNDGMSYPYQMTLGAIQNQELIGEMGRQIAEQCRRIGINVDFAPDIDVNNEPQNPVIGMRSFGEDPKQVAQRGAQYALALQNNGVLPTMKHFPGHGDTKTDSHEALPKIDKKLKQIKKTELYPFDFLIHEGVAGAMVGHIYMPALEPQNNLSSSISKNIVKSLFKDEMGFDGIIFSDAMEMKGAYQGIHPDEVGLKALLAGIDVILMPMNPENTILNIVNQIDNEEVASRVEESCKKVLRYKYRLGLTENQQLSELFVDNDLHQLKYYNLKQRLYNEAVTMIRNEKETLPLDKSQKIAVVTFGKKDNVTEKLEDEGYDVCGYLINGDLNGTKKSQIINELKNYRQVVVNIQNTSIYATRNFGINDNMTDFVKEITKNNKIIFNLFACPYALDKFTFKKTPAAIVIGYEDTKEAVNAVVDVMTGKMNPIGKLPVSIGKKYKAGTGLSFEGMLTPESLPVELIDNEYIREVDSIALNGIEIGAYPGCQILAMKDGKIIYDKCFGHFTYDGEHEVQSDDVYDIASLTKVFATTFAIMKLYDDGKISLETKLSDYFPYLKNTNKKDIRLIEVMTHQAGLTGWIPIYKTMLKNDQPDPDIFRKSIDEDHTVRVAKDMYISKDFNFAICETVKDSDTIKKKYKYSDLGFYLLPKIVEMVTNMPFEQYLEESFYKPLNLNHIYYKPLKHIDIDKIAPTENDTYFRMQLLQGDVHDQAAALMGGVSGHAGLFANARDLAVMMQLLLNEGYANNRQFLSSYTIKKFTSAPFVDNMNRRGIGFDKPEVDPSVTYYTPAKQSSMRSFGHTGFTGTFAWADPENGLVVIFLSNRVYPDANNNKLSQQDIRTKIHEAFYDAVR